MEVGYTILNSMSRLFVTPREIQFINDITKELTKDVAGQYILYYPVSALKTRIDSIYEEAIEKIFDQPIKVDVLAGQTEWEEQHTLFGQNQTANIEVFVHVRDLLDKGYELTAGDFFVYGDAAFEVLSAIKINQVFGQAENIVGIKVTGKLARKSQFDLDYYKQILRDNNINFMNSDVQKVWSQQRGLPNDAMGEETGDVRQLRDRLGDEMAPVALGDGPRIINIDKDTEKASSFDNESTIYPGAEDIYNED